VVENIQDRIEKELATIRGEVRRRSLRLGVLSLLCWAAVVIAITLIFQNPETRRETQTTALYFMIIGWTTLWIYAYFLRMERKQDLLIRVMFEGRARQDDLQEKATKVIDDIGDVASKVRVVVDEYAKQGDMAKAIMQDLKTTLVGNGNGTGTGVFGSIEKKLSDLVECFKAPTDGGLKGL